MALGVPVIASRSGGIPEIITNEVNGLLTTPGNPKDIADCIIRLLEEKDLKKRLIKSGKNRALQFDLKLHVEKMTNIFDQIITKGK